MAHATLERSTKFSTPDISGDKQTIFSNPSPDETDDLTSPDVTETADEQADQQDSPEDIFNPDVKTLDAAARKRGIYVVSAALVGGSPQERRDAIALLCSPNEWASGRRSTQAELDQLARLAQLTLDTMHPAATPAETADDTAESALAQPSTPESTPHHETRTSKSRWRNIGKKIINYFSASPASTY